MKIIFSPSKEMREENIFENKKIIYTQPFFKEKVNFLNQNLQKKSLNEIATIMKLKGALLDNTYNNIQNFNFLKEIPAISLYYGVAFKELDLLEYSDESLKYLNNNLLILSAFYGLSLPFNLLKKYRLDMTMSIFDKSLYNFWKDDINNYLKKNLEDNEILLNLASNEFSKIVDKKTINMISLDFKEEENGTYKSVSSYSKQARGIFLNHLIKNKINDIDSIKKINLAGYSLNKSLSDEKNLIFTR